VVPQCFEYFDHSDGTLTAEQGLNRLMQLAQGRIAAYQNASPKVRAGAAQNNMELIGAKGLI
jgi:hypothetical protein